MTDFMSALDADFRAATGLHERRLYKIFYSHVHPFPLLVLGQNPGGTTDGTDLSASERFFEGWEHDYVRFRADPRYTLARPAYELLSETLGTRSEAALRQVPTSNVIFRRSPNTAALPLSPADAARESQPFVARLVKEVNPKVLLFFGSESLKLFRRFHVRPGSSRVVTGRAITTPNGAHSAVIFGAEAAFIECLGREAHLFMVGHPSKYSGRREWAEAVSELADHFVRLGLRPLESSGALVPLPTGR